MRARGDAGGRRAATWCTEETTRVERASERASKALFVAHGRTHTHTTQLRHIFLFYNESESLFITHVRDKEKSYYTFCFPPSRTGGLEKKDKGKRTLQSIGRGGKKPGRGDIGVMANQNGFQKEGAVFFLLVFVDRQLPFLFSPLPSGKTDHLVPFPFGLAHATARARGLPGWKGAPASQER